MLEKGMYPDFLQKAITELEKIKEPLLPFNRPGCHDLRNLLWCSIDNDDSLDLDQLTAAEQCADGTVKIFVAIADVDSLVKKQSAIDNHAKHNTTSVYTAGATYAMIPEKLSNNLTSLNLNADRAAVVIEMCFNPPGTLVNSKIYEAVVKNHAKLTYNGVSAWLENGQIPQGIRDVPGLDENIRLQEKVAQQLKLRRQENGALDLETIETKPVFEGDILKELTIAKSNRASFIIEDFMIAANGVTARFLTSKNFPSVRRVVRVPKRWDRIVLLAAEKEFKLPAIPDSKALEQFLESQEKASPLTFPDLSLSIIKLLGPGEYVIEMPGEKPIGHFGLAVKDYAHSTAPNRRYPDVITQRLIKAAIAGKPCPYTKGELEILAKHCTEMEDAAKKVERQVEKSAAALLLEGRLGNEFDAIVTGVNEKGTWVRLIDPPVEGKLLSSPAGLDVGNQLKVWLEHTDVKRGFIDFRTGDKNSSKKPYQKPKFNKDAWRQNSRKFHRKNRNKNNALKMFRV